MRDRLTEQEFVFREHLTEDGRIEYIPHRVFTRANTKMFIESEPYDPEVHHPGDLLLWWTFRHKSWTLNNRELEETGSTICKKTGDKFHIRAPSLIQVSEKIQPQ